MKKETYLIGDNDKAGNFEKFCGTLAQAKAQAEKLGLQLWECEQNGNNNCLDIIADFRAIERETETMKLYKVTRTSKISNCLVEELNAMVLPQTFNGFGIEKADLYRCTNSADTLVGHGTCKPINSEFVETVLLNLAETADFVNKKRNQTKRETTNEHLPFFVPSIFTAWQIVTSQNLAIRALLAEISELLQLHYNTIGYEYLNNHGCLDKSSFTRLAVQTDTLFDWQVKKHLQINLTDGTDYQKPSHNFSVLDFYAETESFQLLAHDVRSNRRLATFAHANPSYITPQLNQSFRAFHDICHVAGDYDFTITGESKTFVLQALALLTLHAKVLVSASPHQADVIRALYTEIIGQGSALRYAGKFPVQKPIILRRSYAVAKLLVKLFNTWRGTETTN